MNEFSVPRKWREFRNISIHGVAVYHSNRSRLQLKLSSRQKTANDPFFQRLEKKENDVNTTKIADSIRFVRGEVSVFEDVTKVSTKMEYRGFILRSENGARAYPVRYRYRGVSADNK